MLCGRRKTKFNFKFGKQQEYIKFLKERLFLWSDIFETLRTISKSEDLSEKYHFRIVKYNLRARFWSTVIWGGSSMVTIAILVEIEVWGLISKWCQNKCVISLEWQRSPTSNGATTALPEFSSSPSKTNFAPRTLREAKRREAAPPFSFSRSCCNWLPLMASCIVMVTGALWRVMSLRVWEICSSTKSNGVCFGFWSFPFPSS